MAVADPAPERTAARHQNAPAVPVDLDTLSKAVGFRPTAEPDDAERTALDHDVTVRRGQGRTLRVSARLRSTALSSPAASPSRPAPSTPAQRRARREYDSRVSLLPSAGTVRFAAGDRFLPAPHHPARPAEGPRLRRGVPAPPRVIHEFFGTPSIHE
jgi:hypothetical protein